MWTSNQRTMKWASEGEKGRTKYMANVDEKAFIKKTKHTNKRAGFDVNQANYLGDNLKKKERSRKHVHLCHIFKWHTITTPHTFSLRLPLKQVCLTKMQTQSLWHILVHTHSEMFSLNFDFGCPLQISHSTFVNMKYTHALAFSQ